VSATCIIEWQRSSQGKIPVEQTTALKTVENNHHQGVKTGRKRSLIMQIFLVFLGLVIIGFTLSDLLLTTLTLDGGGPLVNTLARWIWKAMLRHHRCASSQRLLSFTGLGILLSTTLLWLSLVWAGWTLIFSASDQAVVNADSKEPVGLWERAYFTGYTLFTLGLGDYVPQGAIWQLATAIAAANGFVLVSLTITYLVPVISAAAQKRQLAAYISSLGKTSDDIILKAWNGKNFAALTQHLVSLTPMLLLHGQRHLAYPVLHYFHSSERYTAATLSVAVLDETLTLLKYGIEPVAQIDRLTLYAARQAMSVFLETLSSTFLEPATEAPPIPALDRIRAGGIPTVSDEAFYSAVSGLARRRQLLLALVQSHGWDWDDVCTARTAYLSRPLDRPRQK